MATVMDPVAKDKAREELRRLTRDAGGSYPGYILLRAMKDFADLQRKGRGNEKATKSYKHNLLKMARDKLHAFAFQEDRYKLWETNAAMDVNSFYYWNPMHALVHTINGEAEDYNEAMVNLKHAKIAVDRKRTIYDEYDANIVINRHALGRMMERGACNDAPLDCLADQLSEWYPLAMALLVTHHFRLDDGYTGFIPFGNGAFLTKVSFTRFDMDNKGNNLSRRRAAVDKGKFWIGTAPHEPLLDSELDEHDGYPVLQLSTYISSMQFSSAQWWAQIQMKEVREEFGDFLADLYPKLIHSAQLIPDIDDIKERLDAFHARIIKVIEHPKWKAACNLP